MLQANARVNHSADKSQIITAEREREREREGERERERGREGEIWLEGKRIERKKGLVMVKVI